jgi:hypothetical protein
MVSKETDLGASVRDARRLLDARLHEGEVSTQRHPLSVVAAEII